MNPQAQGTRYPDVSFQVSPARLDAFRRVFGQTQGVPPTFITAAEFSVFPLIIGDRALSLDFTRVVHADQSYTYNRPLVEGETLVVRARIESIRQRGDTGFLVVVMELVGQDGEIAAVSRSTMVEGRP
jgi:N-terminal half of MaoC dehydratase